IYVLPFSNRELLVEDTRFELSRELQRRSYEQGIAAYIESLGIPSYRVTYSEEGCLPLPLYGAQSPLIDDPTAAAGISGGIFHAATGYSIGPAVEFASWLERNADNPNLTR